MFIDNNLSDNFEGKITGRNSHKETFAVSLKNKTEQSVKIVLFPGNLRTNRPEIPVEDAGTLKVPIIGGTNKQAVATGTNPFETYDAPNAVQRYEAAKVVLDDGINNILYALDATKTLEVAIENGSVREVVSHICQAPADLEKIRFNVNSREALNKLTIIEMNPFGTDIKKRTIELADYIDPANQQDGLLDIDLSRILGQKLQLDENTLLILDMPGKVNTPSGLQDSTMKITFWFKDFVKQAAVASVLKQSGF